MTAAWPLHDDGTWREVVAPGGGPGLFLDRDGVIVEDTGFLARAGDVRLLDGGAELVVRANRRGVPVVVVTNQSGIGRGFFGWEDFAAVQHEITRRLERAGGRWNAVYASPFPPGDHAMRKPRPGLLRAAAETLGIELAASWIVGDRATDIEAGFNAGLAGGILVGDRERQRALALAAPGRFTVHAVADPGEAPALLPILLNP